MSLVNKYVPRMVPEGKQARHLELLRSEPIRGFFGSNGSGKSFLMLASALADLDEGKPCLSTVRVLDYNNPRMCEETEETCDDWIGHNREKRGIWIGHKQAHPNYIPFTEWWQLLEFTEGIILADEITGVADSAQSADLPPAVGDMLHQLRRDDIVFCYTGVAFGRAHKRIREATRIVTMSEGWLPTTAYGPDGKPMMWKHRRLTKARTYEAKELVEAVPQDYQEKLKKSFRGSAFYWVPDHRAALAYDTYDQPLRIGTVSDAGRCAYCGGTRRAPECSCEDYRARKAAGRTSAGSARKRRSREDGPDAAALSSGPVPSTASPLASLAAAHGCSEDACSCAVA
jgi:hypothetical protein